MMLDAEEQALLTAAALRHGVDPLFLFAIRAHEAGEPGGAWGEMGIPTAQAPSFEDQAAVAAKTVRNRLAEYPGNPFRMLAADGGGTHRRLAYTAEFIAWFASRWAPVGAANDPQHLNAAWPASVTRLYEREVRMHG